MVRFETKEADNIFFPYTTNELWSSKSLLLSFGLKLSLTLTLTIGFLCFGFNHKLIRSLLYVLLSNPKHIKEHREGLFHLTHTVLYNNCCI